MTSSSRIDQTSIINNTDFTCTVCNQRMSTKDSLRRHMMRHTGEKPYACHICDYRAIQKTHLKAHIYYNHGEQELTTVSLSPQLVPSVYRKLKKKEVERMQDQRYPYGPYRCERCDVGFRKNDNLRRHNVKRHNNESDIPNGISTLVVPSFRQAQTRRTGKESTYSVPAIITAINGFPPVRQTTPGTASFSLKSEPVPVSLLAYVQCPVCPKLLSSDNRLRLHLLTHAGVRPFSCSACGKNFKQKFHLKRHVIQVHKPTDPELSLSSFTKLEKLRREASVQCPVCSRILSNPDTLRRHMLIHQGIKPFSCELCGETFRQKHHVQVHVSRHHRDGSVTNSSSFKDQSVDS